MEVDVRSLFVWTSSADESQKGVNAAQPCSVENQKGAITLDSVQQ